MAQRAQHGRRSRLTYLYASLASIAFSLSPTNATSSTEPAGATTPGAIGTRLRQLPASAGTDRAVRINAGDLDVVTELVGVERPTDFEDVARMAAWQSAVFGVRLPAGPEGAPPRSPAAVPIPEVAMPDDGEMDWRQGDGRRGWNLLDLAWFVEVMPDSFAPEITAALGGTFGADRLNLALGPTHDGVWARDSASIGHRSDIHPWTWRYAGLAGNTLVLSDREDSVRAALGGSTPTWGDDADVAALADTLDRSGVYSATFRLNPNGFPFPQHPASSETVERALTAGVPLPQPFRGFAVGLASPPESTDETIVVLAYVHDNESAARANAVALEDRLVTGVAYNDGRPWSEFFVLESVVTEGRVITARLHRGDVSSQSILELSVVADASLFTHV